MIINNDFINTSLNKLKSTKQINNIKDELVKKLLVKQNTEEPYVKTSDINNTLKDILKSSGFNVNEETINMLLNLLDNNIPLNDNTLQQLSKALKLFNINNNKTSEPVYNKVDVEKAIFMLNNKLPVNQSNTQILDGFINGESHFMHRLTSLGENIDNLDNSKIKNGLINTLLENVLHNYNDTNEINKTHHNNLNIIKNNTEKNIIITKENVVEMEKQIQLNTLTPETLNEILKPNAPFNTTEILEIIKFVLENNENLKDSTSLNLVSNNKLNINSLQLKNNLVKTLPTLFSLNPNSDNPKDLDILLNQLKENLNSAETLLLNSNYSDTLKSITQTKETLDFLNLIKESVYIPLPLNIGQQTLESEIFVFKDSKYKKNKNKNSTSALVALNTVYLGRIETYIQKNSNNLNLQFRLENMETETIIKANINKLESLLSSFNYNIKSYSVIPIETPFNIISKEPITYEQMKSSSKTEVNVTIDTRA